jgi:choice-of-anchor B domain-containing protein
MKFFYAIIISVFSFNFSAQTYPSQNISLVSLLTPNTSTTGIGPDGRKYSGCWAWYQSSKNKEYAISGTSIGTYFIDITSAATPTVSDFVPATVNSTYKEIKTYQNFCYIVGDDAAPNRFQIIDMQYLPDSVHVVYDGKSYFERGHTVWIDKDKLYVGGVTYSIGSVPPTSPMNVYSLATPSVPVLLRQLWQDIPSSVAGYVHDMYVRNDTIYASCGNDGLRIIKLNPANTFSLLGSYTNYAGTPYNHSSFLTQNGKYLIFCDESPSKLPMKIVDVQNFSNVTSMSVFNSYTTTTPHNPYLIGNNLAIVSCYQDGLMVYNISNPATPTLTGFFDTHPQGGAISGSYGSSDYRGNWGAYPWLPSGNIVTNDMQNGVFILNASAAYSATTGAILPPSTVGLKTNNGNETNLIFYPNPAADRLAVNYNSNNEVMFKICDAVGEIILEKKYTNGINNYIEVDNLANGTYFINVKSASQSVTKKLIIQH